MPRPTAVLVLLAAVASRPAAAQVPPAPIPPPPYRVTWWDAASVATAGVLGVLPGIANLPRGLPSCAPCDPAALPGIDRVALHTFSRPAGTASHALLAGVAGFAGLTALDWSFAASDWLKVLAHRNRPVLYTAGAPAAASDPDTRRSFPSGHAAVAFAAATSYAVMAARERLPHRTRNTVLLYTGAVGVAALRVAGGKHFPTDVAGGAALGVAIGWFAARVHPTVR